MTTQWQPITARYVSDVVILDLSAHSVSFSEGPGRLVGRIEEHLSQGWRKVLLNLPDVALLDSEGLGEIIRGYKEARETGGTLKVCGAVRHVRDLLAATKLDRHIEVFDSEREALESFASPV